MKRRRGDLERETDQGHDEAGGKNGRDYSELGSDRRETGRASCSVNKTDPEQGERAGGASKKKIFQARFGGTHIAFIESGQDIKREAGQLEANENDE